MNRVIHFEVGAVAPERAAKFYSAVFGWKADRAEQNGRGTRQQF